VTDCGIRPATTAEAEFLQDYIQKSNNNAGQSSINAARLASEQAESANKANDDGSENDDDDDSEGNHSTTGSKRNSLVLSNDVNKAVVYADDLSDKTPTAATLLSQAQAQRPGTYPSQASIRRHPGQEPILGSVQTHSPQQSLGAASSYMGGQTALSARQFPHFPSIDEAVGANSTSTHGIAGREVWNWFQDHLDALLESMRTFRFDQFEMNLRTFWSNLTGNHREVVHAPAIAGLMAKADAIVYDVCGLFYCCCVFHAYYFLLQEILEILRSQMLSPIPAASLTNLRQLALKMEKILLAALDGYGNTFVEPKVELGARFGHLICALSFSSGHSDLIIFQSAFP
jgi:regulatory factor X